MSEIWDTKDGRRRVRRDPPTVEEAVLAAQGLTDELSEQAEIVASLMQISAEEARGAVLAHGTTQGRRPHYHRRPRRPRWPACSAARRRGRTADAAAAAADRSKRFA